MRSLASGLGGGSVPFLLLVLLCPLPARAGSTTLVSLNQAGTASANSYSSPVAMSSNGRFVLFSSSASDLTPNDANLKNDVFVRDLCLLNGRAIRGCTPSTILVSLNQAGTVSANGNSFPIAMTANGRFVLFSSSASDLTPNDANSKNDVFVRDLCLVNGRAVRGCTPSTLLVSLNQAGTASANANSSPVAISRNGRFVLFWSTARDVVQVPTVGADSYVRDLCVVNGRAVRGCTPSTILVSLNHAGTSGGNGGSTPIAMTANGRFVLMQSTASDLVPNDANSSSPDAFVRDLCLVNGRAVRDCIPSTLLVSVNHAGTATGNAGSYPTAMSADGRFVLFKSQATNLVLLTTVGFDAYVRDLCQVNGRAVRDCTPSTTLVGVNQAGTAGGNLGSDSIAMSANGRFVLFRSQSSDLGPNDTSATDDVFVRDLCQVNGRAVRDCTPSTILVTMNQAGIASGNGHSMPTAMSANGRFVLFWSEASDLVPNDTNSSRDTFVRDLCQVNGRAVSGCTPSTMLVSLNQAGTTSGNATSQAAALSPDGHFVLFYSEASDLVPNDTNSAGDVFVHDLR